MNSDRRAALVLIFIGCAYVWAASGLRPFSRPMDAAVAAPIALILGLWWRRRRREHDRLTARPSLRSPDAAVWAGLLLLLCAWELLAYSASPRHDHPTLSSMSDDLMSTHPGRAVTFALWFGVGWLLFVRRRPARP